MIIQEGWNRESIRFIDPPTFRWAPVDDAATYRVSLGQRGDSWTLETKTPEQTLTPVWSDLEVGPFRWSVVALTRDGTPCDQSELQKVYKGPDFDDEWREPRDWEEAASALLDWLLSRPTYDGKRAYWVASSQPDVHDGSLETEKDTIGHEVVYPALSYSSQIWFFLEMAKRLEDSERIELCETEARELADWLIENSWGPDAACSHFPPTTRVTGDVDRDLAESEDESITLFRAARAGNRYLELYEYFGAERYLEQARRLADGFAEFQRDDGSWPYRVHPETGEVVQEYTSAAIVVADYLEHLHDVIGKEPHADVIDRAVEWTIENPVETNRWEGMFEDIPADRADPFGNLHNWDVNYAIRYFSRHADEDSRYLDVARELNRFVEDQFVIFGPHESHLPGDPIAPVVMEQYVCYWPMEVHTANWLLALKELHRATGEEEYLKKGIQAANAIADAQEPNGQLSTWGVDRELGVHFLAGGNWYACNAVGGVGLVQWSEYVDSLEPPPRAGR